MSVLASIRRRHPARHRQTGRQIDWGKCKNTLCCIGQAQGAQAVQRQTGLEHSASHKTAFLPWIKKKGKKDSQDSKSRKGTSENLLAHHSVTCGDMKGTQKVSPKAKDLPVPVSAK